MRNRNHIVVVHLNDKEYDRLNQKCRQAGLRREQFARAAFEGINIRPRPPDTYKELAREIAAVGNNLNQIAHRVNSTGYVTQAQFEQVMDIMSRIWKTQQEQPCPPRPRALPTGSGRENAWPSNRLRCGEGSLDKTERPVAAYCRVLPSGHTAFRRCAPGCSLRLDGY